MADVLLFSRDGEDIRFVVPALEQVGHIVHMECAGHSLAALPLARYGAIVIDLTSTDLPDGELLNAARVLHDRDEPGLLVVGVATNKRPELTAQSRIIVLPAPFVPSAVVDALQPLQRYDLRSRSIASRLARRIQGRYNARNG